MLYAVLEVVVIQIVVEMLHISREDVTNISIPYVKLF